MFLAYEVCSLSCKVTAVTDIAYTYTLKRTWSEITVGYVIAFHGAEMSEAIKQIFVAEMLKSIYWLTTKLEL